MEEGQEGIKVRRRVRKGSMRGRKGGECGAMTGGEGEGIVDERVVDKRVEGSLEGTGGR